MRKERRDHTLQATALVNEAFLNSAIGGREMAEPANASECAKAMRRILWTMLAQMRRASVEMACEGYTGYAKSSVGSGYRSCSRRAVTRCGIGPQQSRMIKCLLRRPEMEQTAEVINMAPRGREWRMAKPGCC